MRYYVDRGREEASGGGSDGGLELVIVLVVVTCGASDVQSYDEGGGVDISANVLFDSKVTVVVTGKVSLMRRCMWCC